MRYEPYRQMRQREGVTLAELSAESDITKDVLLKWECGSTRLMRCDVRRIFLALKSLIGKRGVRRSWCRTVTGRSELRAKPVSCFSNMGRIGG